MLHILIQTIHGLGIHMCIYIIFINIYIYMNQYKHNIYTYSYYVKMYPIYIYVNTYIHIICIYIYIMRCIAVRICGSPKQKCKPCIVSWRMDSCTHVDFPGCCFGVCNL